MEADHTANRVDKNPAHRKKCRATNMGILLMSPTEQPILAGGIVRDGEPATRAVWLAPAVVKIVAADAQLGTRPTMTDGQFTTS